MIPRPRRLSRGAAAVTIAALLASPLFAVSASAVEVLPEPVAVPDIRGTGAPQPSDRFIVKFKERASATAKTRGSALGVAAKEFGVSVKELRATGTGATVVETSRHLGAGEAADFVEALEANRDVDYAEADQLLQANAITPTDGYYDYQWSLFDDVAGIDADRSWEATDGDGVTVAVVDTGITSHPDLDANVLPGYDMLADPAHGRDGDGRDNNAQDEGDYGSSGECGISDSSWHGTHVAGTIAAGLDGEGIVGVAPRAKIVPVRVLAECGGWMSDIADGLIWASGGTVAGVPANANPARVVNMSLGGRGFCSTSMQSAIDGAVSRGSVVVVAAGNSYEDTSMFTPANCQNVVTVAAAGAQGQMAAYSNYGDPVDLTAPGGDMGNDYLDGILSTLNAGTTTPGEPNYAFYQGTSMATPHVAGVAALMLAANPGLTPAQIEATLKTTTRPLPVPCDLGCGAGLLNARAAVAAVHSGDMPADPNPDTEILPGDVVITGIPSVDRTLTVAATGWQPSDVQFSYQWFRGSDLNPIATGTSYKLTPRDADEWLFVVATGTKAGYPDVSRESAPAGPVEPGTFTPGTPTVAGTTRVGQVLTANPGTWSPTPDSLTYQWLRNGTAIVDATGTDYTLRSEDHGSTLSVRVTGTRGTTTLTATSVETATIQWAELTGSVPVIQGTATFGQTLAVVPGTWTEGTTYGYQWLRNGVAITGRTAASYTIVPEDVGQRISVRVSGTKTGYTTLTKDSAPTGAVAAAALTAPKPTVAGTTTVGYTLSANTGTWTTGTTLKYQWYRTGVAIPGATAAAYALTASDLGKNISVGVTGSKPGYTSSVQFSARTVAVLAGSLTAPRPTVAGSTKVGYTLSANTGTWTTGTTLKYQWYRTGVAISGATAAKYTLNAADLGKNMSVGVTGSKAGYTTTVNYSARTAAVVAGTLSVPQATVSGTTRVNYTLTANPGTWTSGTTIKYQWFRSGVRISGAAGKAYRLTTADLGKNISVGVYGSKAGYTSSVSYSARTRAITR